MLQTLFHSPFTWIWGLLAVAQFVFFVMHLNLLSDYHAKGGLFAAIWSFGLFVYDVALALGLVVPAGRGLVKISMIALGTVQVFSAGALPAVVFLTVPNRRYKLLSLIPAFIMAALGITCAFLSEFELYHAGANTYYLPVLTGLSLENVVRIILAVYLSVSMIIGAVYTYLKEKELRLIIGAAILTVCTAAGSFLLPNAVGLTLYLLGNCAAILCLLLYGRHHLHKPRMLKKKQRIESRKARQKENRETAGSTE